MPTVNGKEGGGGLCGEETEGTIPGSVNAVISSKAKTIGARREVQAIIVVFNGKGEEGREGTTKRKKRVRTDSRRKTVKVRNAKSEPNMSRPFRKNVWFPSQAWCFT